VIVLCDTSALLKLFIEEEHSAAVAATASAADGVAVARLAWAEAMAAIARRAREVPRDAALLEQARHAFAERWPDLLVLDATQAVVEQGADFAEVFALRAYDAVQLATLQTLRLQATDEVRFACFDSRLREAALTLGIQPAG
jgi:uncharacterized protein